MDLAGWYLCEAVFHADFKSVILFGLWPCISTHKAFEKYGIFEQLWLILGTELSKLTPSNKGHTWQFSVVLALSSLDLSQSNRFLTVDCWQFKFLGNCLQNSSDSVFKTAFPKCNERSLLWFGDLATQLCAGSNFHFLLEPMFEKLHIWEKQSILHFAR